MDLEGIVTCLQFRNLEIILLFLKLLCFWLFLCLMLPYSITLKSVWVALLLFYLFLQKSLGSLAFLMFSPLKAPFVLLWNLLENSPHWKALGTLASFALGIVGHDKALTTVWSLMGCEQVINRQEEMSVRRLL